MDKTNQTDKSNMINVLESIPEQIAEAVKLAKDVKVTEPIKKIMVAGMGGSAVSGDILKAYLKDKIDVTVNKDYFLPELAGKETLLFIVSYSGNTEETISTFRTAQRKNISMIVITTGGKLEELSKISKTPCIIIPRGFQPRAALAYLFFPMLAVLYNSHFIDNPTEDIKKTIKALKNPKFKERAQDLAERLVERCH